MNKDLRTHVNDLEQRGLLLRVGKQVDPYTQMSALISEAWKIDKTVLFENVKGYDGWTSIGGLATRKSLATALGFTDFRTLAPELSRKLHERKLTECRMVDGGPVKDLIFEKESVDLKKLPITKISGVDIGPYIGSGLLICKDPETGIRNVSIHRHQVMDKDKLGIMMAPRHTWMIYRKYEQLNKPMPCAIVIGHHPACYVAGTWTTEFGVDELEIAGTLLNEPLELVKCSTIDLEVPSQAEIVIEGEIPPKIREMEGPFGEHTGCTVAGMGMNPIIKVKAITRRKDAIYYAMVEGDNTDGSTLDAVPMEAELYRRLKSVGGHVDLRNVVVPEYVGGAHVVIVQMVPRFEGEAKQVLMAALSSQYLHPKIAIAVDEDVDPFKPSEILWSLSTKVNPEEDVFCVSGVRSINLDSSLRPAATLSGAAEMKIGGKMGIDATKPPIVKPKEREELARIFPTGHGETRLEDFL